jgi:hypothetical protein
MSHRVWPLPWIAVLLVTLAGCASTASGRWLGGGGDLPQGAGGDWRTDAPARERVRIAARDREPTLRPAMHREFVQCPQCGR